MRTTRIAALILLGSSVMLWARGGSRMGKISAAERERVNPFAGNAEAAAAGRVVFMEHCAQCHGKNALGRRGPSLRSEVIARTPDGELAWILKNGIVRRGMPSWNSLPEAQRWQIIAYLRSLPRDVAAARNSAPQGADAAANAP